MIKTVGNYYRPEHFVIEELMPPDMMGELTEDQLWGLLNPRLLFTMDNLRKVTNRRITGNNWFWGGLCENRGYRTAKSVVGAKYSQHRIGNALDFVVEGTEPWAVRNWLRSLSWEERCAYGLQYITYMEDLYKETKKPITWVHLDCRNTTRERANAIHFFNV